MGISPDIIVMRCDEPVDEEICRKIALFCNVKPDCVIENLTLPVLYEAPVMLEKMIFQHCLPRAWNRRAGARTARVDRYARLHQKPHAPRTIGLVGKYFKLHDAYLSVAEAHAGYACAAVAKATRQDDAVASGEAPGHVLRRDGLAVEGMVPAAGYCREHNVPYFGICLGMQIAVIEFARHVAGLSDANSGEFVPETPHKVIDFMPDQNKEIAKGGTMRLGAYPCHVLKGTRMYECYGRETISERHRHRYECKTIIGNC